MSKYPEWFIPGHIPDFWARKPEEYYDNFEAILSINDVTEYRNIPIDEIPEDATHIQVIAKHNTEECSVTVYFGRIVKVYNKQYNGQLRRYNKELEEHNQKVAQYQELMKLYKEDCDKKERALYNKLKRKFENE